jgi:hypothetical protein
MKFLRLLLISLTSMLCVCVITSQAQQSVAVAAASISDTDKEKIKREANTYNESEKKEAVPNIHAPWVHITNNLEPKLRLKSLPVVQTQFFPHLMKPVSANPQDNTVEIVSPTGNYQYAVPHLTISIKLGSSIKSLQLLITKKAKTDTTGNILIPATIAYDSDLVEVTDTTKRWTERIELAIGKYELKAIGIDANGKQISSATVEVERLKGSPPDQRDTFEASAYIGYAIDSFAASDLRKYLNPQDSGGVTERIVGGFDFAYRLYGDPMKRKGHQLWIYGETVHGVRSADVDCQANPNSPLCKDLDFNPATAGDTITAILRNATSLEAFAGLRWEFATINKSSDSPARLYLKSQFGFLSVARFGGDVVDVHQYLGLGLTATSGTFKNSYVEIGRGKTDLVLDNRTRRWKIDGFLSWGSSSGGALGVVRPFAQMTVDSDFGKGSDSVQTYFGIDFDLSFLWGGNKP